MAIVSSVGYDRRSRIDGRASDGRGYVARRPSLTGIGGTILAARHTQSARFSLANGRARCGRCDAACSGSHRAPGDRALWTVHRRAYAPGPHLGWRARAHGRRTRKVDGRSSRGQGVRSAAGFSRVVKLSQSHRAGARGGQTFSDATRTLLLHRSTNFVPGGPCWAAVDVAGLRLPGGQGLRRA